MADRYQQQLTNLSDVVVEKRPFTAKAHRKVIFFHDNAQSHVAKATQNLRTYLCVRLGISPAHGV